MSMQKKMKERKKKLILVSLLNFSKFIEISLKTNLYYKSYDLVLFIYKDVSIQLFLYLIY